MSAFNYENVFLFWVLKLSYLYANLTKISNQRGCFMGLKFLEEELDNILLHNQNFSKWEDEFYQKLENGKFISIKIFELINKTPINWNNFWIHCYISTFTLTSNVENFMYSLKFAMKKGVIKSFEKNNNGDGFEILTKDDIPIRFIKITDFLPSLDEKLKNRLQSKQRCGYCHWDSIHLSTNLETPSNVVSGYCSMQSKKKKFPHSWVEIEEDGKEFVLDFTMNVVMNKEGYYKLYNPQNLIKIDNETLKEDLALRKRTSFDCKDIRMYLFYPNEVRDEMQKEVEQYKTYETGEWPWILVEKNL